MFLQEVVSFLQHQFEVDQQFGQSVLVYPAILFEESQEVSLSEIKDIQEDDLRDAISTAFPIDDINKPRCIRSPV